MKERSLPFTVNTKVPGTEEDDEEEKSLVRTIFEMSMAKVSATTTAWMKKMLRG